VAIQADKLLALELPEKATRYTARDSMIYAIGIGMAADPMDPRILPFCFDKDQKAFPTQATVIAWDETWVQHSGIDFLKALHGEQRIVWHRPLPPAAEIRYKVRVTDVFDKGPGRGAVIVIHWDIKLASGEPLCTLDSVVFARADGGFGGKTGSPPPLAATPETAPDFIVDLPTRPEAALLYRQSGDPNPLHTDPETAKAAGFPMPILQGLNFYGVAAHAVLRSVCDYDPARLKAFAARFAAPVYPGETIRTEIWRTPKGAQFRARVIERNIVVLSHGNAEIA
jgi:acyl dehydratase